MAPVDKWLYNHFCGANAQANDPFTGERIANDHGGYCATATIAVGLDKTASSSFSAADIPVVDYFSDHDVFYGQWQFHCRPLALAPACSL